MTTRKVDWFFVGVFLCFAFTSVFSDAVHGLGRIDDSTLMGRANLWYAALAGDDFLLDENVFARLSTLISGFIYGPFYLVMAYAFYRGRNWIRIPAFVYVGSMLHGWTEFMYWEMAMGKPPRNLVVFLAFYMPYGIVPLLLAWRLRKPEPFTQDAHGVAPHGTAQRLATN